MSKPARKHLGHPWNESCTAHPEDGTHECMRDEMRCAYCGVRIDPWPCNGCNKFLDAKTMHEIDTEGGNRRCDDCQ